MVTPTTFHSKLIAIVFTTYLIIATQLIIAVTNGSSLNEEDNLNRELADILWKLDLSYKGVVDEKLAQRVKSMVNEAINLFERAEESIAEGNDDLGNELVTQAREIIKEAGILANRLSEESQARYTQIRIIAWALVPISSLTTALTLVKLYGLYISRERRKLLKMVVRLREESEEK